jgi:hypothetical protein
VSFNCFHVRLNHQRFNDLRERLSRQLVEFTDVFIADAAFFINQTGRRPKTLSLSFPLIAIRL